MKQRFIFAIVFACLALIILCLRYAPPQIAAHAVGDPADHNLVSGFLGPESDNGLVVRRSLGTGRLVIPLADGRGALQVALRLRSDEPGVVAVSTGLQTLQLTSTPVYRTYNLLVPPRSGPSMTLTVTSRQGNALLVDEVLVAGRPGWPSLVDLLALLMVAAVPALLMVLTARLPFDWALLPSFAVLGLLYTLPLGDRRPLLSFGPLVALAVCALTISPWMRARPTFALLLLLGGALRCYALAWGNGYAFHPEEQALAVGDSSGVHALLVRATAQLLSWLSGQVGWSTGWGLVLVGRFWSAVAGTTLIAVVYVLGQGLLRPRWALLATAFVACTPGLVQQSHLASQAQWIVLGVALLMLLSTRMLSAPGPWITAATVGVSASLIYSSPFSTVWLAAPAVVHLLSRQKHPAFVARSAVLLTLILAGILRWPGGAVVLAAEVQSVDLLVTNGQPPYLYPLFNILLWGLGPLLMQLGVVGWGAGVVQAFQVRYERRWLPLLAATGLAFAVAGWGPRYSLEELLPLAPLLSLTAAFLLQTFSLRLHFRLGQRTVRLLAGTSLALALGSTLALLNVYRAPDVRIVASRALLGLLTPEDTLALDSDVGVRLPLGVGELHRSLWLTLRTSDESDLIASARALAESSYLVTTLDLAELSVAELKPGAACIYGALSDGRLGFRERTSFASKPHIGSWSIDDRRADPLIRRYDHPALHIYQRIAPPRPEVVEEVVRCITQTTP